MIQVQERLQEVSDNNKLWIRQALFLPRVDMSKRLKTAYFDTKNRGSAERARVWSPGEASFGDTSMGGSRSVNPKPQFTIDADVDMNSFVEESLGMGRYYFEAIDQNAQRIYMQAGIPEFNSLTNFFTSYFDFDTANLVNRGKVQGLVYTVSKLVGYVVLWPVAIPLNILNVVYKAYRTVRRQPMTRFYYLRASMHQYWGMVTNIFNAIVTNMQILLPGDPDAVDRTTNPDEPYKYTEAGDYINPSTPGNKDGKLLADMQKILPDIYRNYNGGIDIRAVATRWQRLANEHNREIRAIMENIADNPAVVNIEEEARKEIAAYFEKNRNKRSLLQGAPEDRSLRSYLDKYRDTAYGRGEGFDDTLYAQLNTEEGSAQLSELGSMSQSDAEGTEEGRTQPPSEASRRASLAYNTDVQKSRVDGKEPTGWWSSLAKRIEEMGEFFEGERKDGSMFVSFIVDYQNEVSESFSNSTSSSTLADAMNSKAKQARNIILNMAGGNVGDNPMFQLAEAVASTLSSAMKGLASSVGLSGLGQLGGSAFVDIPDFWEDSQSSFSSTSYNIPLRSWSGHPYAIMQNIIFPLSCLLPFAVPRKTGHSSYGAPFLCKLWSQGRAQVQLGLVTDMSISRGTSNVGWNPMFQATGVDVSFTVMNLSKLMTMPMAPDVSITKALLGTGVFDDEDNFTDYMGILAGLSLSDQHYHIPRMKLRLARARANFDTWLSVTNLTSWAINETLPGLIISGLSTPAEF